MKSFLFFDSNAIFLVWTYYTPFYARPPSSLGVVKVLTFCGSHVEIEQKKNENSLNEEWSECSKDKTDSYLISICLYSAEDDADYQMIG